MKQFAAEGRIMDHGVNTGIGGIGAWATRRAFLSGERVAFREGARRVTFAEFDRRMDQLVQALRETGIRSGDRVGALMVNSVGFLETMFAAAKLGAIFTPINYRLAAPEVPFLLADFKCPTHVQFVDELPRNATGKVLKNALRKNYSGLEAALGR
jgi:fatty-acyl-CoA synthase